MPTAFSLVNADVIRLLAAFVRDAETRNSARVACRGLLASWPFFSTVPVRVRAVPSAEEAAAWARTDAVTQLVLDPAVFDTARPDAVARMIVRAFPSAKWIRVDEAQDEALRDPSLGAGLWWHLEQASAKRKQRDPGWGCALELPVSMGCAVQRCVRGLHGVLLLVHACQATGCPLGPLVYRTVGRPVNLESVVGDGYGDSRVHRDTGWSVGSEPRAPSVSCLYRYATEKAEWMVVSVAAFFACGTQGSDEASCLVRALFRTTGMRVALCMPGADEAVAMLSAHDASTPGTGYALLDFAARTPHRRFGPSAHAAVFVFLEA